jgi:hypothetical protein
MLDTAKMIVDENDPKTFSCRALIMGGFYIFLVIILSPLKNLSAVRYVLVPCLGVYFYTMAITSKRLVFKKISDRNAGTGPGSY